MGAFTKPYTRSLNTMPFETNTAKLDSLINSLENELGEAPVTINPDDPWASFRLKTFSVSPHLAVNTCTCSYKLTSPFEVICPMCGFKGEPKEMYPLLSIEQMLASLPKPAPVPEKTQQKKKNRQNLKLILLKVETVEIVEIVRLHQVMRKFWLDGVNVLFKLAKFLQLKNIQQLNNCMLFNLMLVLINQDKFVLVW